MYAYIAAFLAHTFLRTDKSGSDLDYLFGGLGLDTVQTCNELSIRSSPGEFG